MEAVSSFHVLDHWGRFTQRCVGHVRHSEEQVFAHKSVWIRARGLGEKSEERQRRKRQEGRKQRHKVERDRGKRGIREKGKQGERTRGKTERWGARWTERPT